MPNIIYKAIDLLSQKSSVVGDEPIVISDTEFITPNQIAERAIVADGTITTSKLSDSAVTTQKIASEAVTEAKLATSLLTKLFSTGYKFAGVATPYGNPGTPNQDVFYLAGAGTYPNYGYAVIMPGQLGVLKYNGGWTTEIISGVGQIVEMANVEEEGLFFADSHLYIGVKIVQEGLTSINSITYREV